MAYQMNGSQLEKAGKGGTPNKYPAEKTNIGKAKKAVKKSKKISAPAATKIGNGAVGPGRFDAVRSPQIKRRSVEM